MQFPEGLENTPFWIFFRKTVHSEEQKAKQGEWVRLSGARKTRLLSSSHSSTHTAIYTQNQFDQKNLQKVFWCKNSLLNHFVGIAAHLYLLRCLAKKTTYILGELVMASSMLVLHGHFEAVYLLQIIKNSRYRRKQFNFELFRPEVAVHKHQISPT